MRKENEVGKHITRKRTMRCEHPTPCDLCLTDCKRAEITAKENEIRSNLLTACKRLIDANEYARNISLRKEPPRGGIWSDVRQHLDAARLKAEAAIKKACPNG